MYKDMNLLYNYLCAILPYNVRCYVPVENKVMTMTGKRLNYFCFHDDDFGLDYRHEIEVVLNPGNGNDFIRPYLRPMSSMTEDEKAEYETLKFLVNTGDKYLGFETYAFIIWLMKHHFDFLGLIEKDMAYTATEDMYKN